MVDDPETVQGPFEFSGGEPRFSYVGRSVEVDKSMFNQFKMQSMGRRSSGLFTAFLQPRDNAEELEEDSGSSRLPRHRSLLGLRIVSPYNFVASLWSMFITFVDATYVAFLVPIILALSFGSPRVIGFHDWIGTLEILAGVTFIADIFVSFHIGFIVQYDYKKKVVMDGKSVIWYYATHGGLWIDLLSTLPLVIEAVTIVTGEDTRIDGALEILRVFRLVRLTRVVESMYLTVFVGSVKRNPLLHRVPVSLVYSVTVIYTLAFMVNFLGCLLYLTARLQNSEFSGTWLEGHNKTNPENYLTSIYWVVTTITTVGYGDFSPRTWIEQVIIIFVMLTHIMLFGLLIGSMSELVKSSRRDAKASENYRARISDVGEWIGRRKIPGRIAKKVHAYYSEIWVRKNSFNEASILAELPMSLRSEIAFTLTRGMLKGLSIFKEVDENTLLQLAGRLVPIDLPPGHELVRQGDPADSMFIIQEGTAIVFQNDVDLKRLVGPATCCEAAILASEISEMSLHIHTVRARTACHIWELKVKDLEPLFFTYPELKESLTEGYRLHMVQTLAKPLSPRSTIEANVESELGVDVTQSDAQNFRFQLEVTSGVDGTFPRLMKETFRRTRHGRSLTVGNDAHDTLNDSVAPMATQKSKEVMGALHIIWDELRNRGTNGMVDLVNKLRQLDASSQGIGFNEFELCLESFKLSERQLMKLFIDSDPYDIGKLDVTNFVKSIRARYLETMDLKLLASIFDYLDSTKTGKLNVLQLMHALRAERHPDVICGKRTKSHVLLGCLPYFRDVDNISKDEFIEFNLDMRVSMLDSGEFTNMECALWGVQPQNLNSHTALHEE